MTVFSHGKNSVFSADCFFVLSSKVNKTVQLRGRKTHKIMLGLQTIAIKSNYKLNFKVRNISISVFFTWEYHYENIDSIAFVTYEIKNFY